MWRIKNIVCVPKCLHFYSLFITLWYKKNGLSSWNRNFLMEFDQGSENFSWLKKRLEKNMLWFRHGLHIWRFFLLFLYEVDKVQCVFHGLTGVLKKWRYFLASTCEIGDIRGILSIFERVVHNSEEAFCQARTLVLFS